VPPTLAAFVIAALDKIEAPAVNAPPMIAPFVIPMLSPLTAPEASNDVKAPAAVVVPPIAVPSIVPPITSKASICTVPVPSGSMMTSPFVFVADKVLPDNAKLPKPAPFEVTEAT